MQSLVAQAGKFRNGSIGVFKGRTLIHLAPPATRIQYLIEQLLKWIKNSKLPQIVKSCVFHYEFEFIHPFQDGNGRMGRMWQSLLLCQVNPVFAWLPVETIIAKKQQAYYKAINLSTKQNNCGVFVLFMLKALRQAIKELQQSIKDVPVNVPINVPINQTQKEVLKQIKRQNNITLDELAAKIGKSRKTILRAVQQLKKSGYLQRTGSNKTGHWEIN
jgi:Fic family protein